VFGVSVATQTYIFLNVFFAFLGSSRQNKEEDTTFDGSNFYIQAGCSIQLCHFDKPNQDVSDVAHIIFML
jgi:hypothetical protein